MVQAYNLHNSDLASVLCHRNFSAFVWPVTTAGGEHNPQEKAVNELDVTSNGRREAVLSLFPLLFFPFPFPRARKKESTQMTWPPVFADYFCIFCRQLLQQELCAIKTQPSMLQQVWLLPSTNLRRGVLSEAKRPNSDTEASPPV